MNRERIILDLPHGSGPMWAEEAARLAYHFTSSKLDGRAGLGGGTAYKLHNGREYVVYWTKARAVVVRSA